MPARRFRHDRDPRNRESVDAAGGSHGRPSVPPASGADGLNLDPYLRIAPSRPRRGSGQDALLKALELWPMGGVPANPGGWLMQVAKNRALDVLRREASIRE